MPNKHVTLHGERDLRDKKLILSYFFLSLIDEVESYNLYFNRSLASAD